eukprot:12423595-Karenia_brevis.AAC.1
MLPKDTFDWKAVVRVRCQHPSLTAISAVLKLNGKRLPLSVVWPKNFAVEHRGHHWWSPNTKTSFGCRK